MTGKTGTSRRIPTDDLWTELAEVLVRIEVDASRDTRQPDPNDGNGWLAPLLIVLGIAGVVSAIWLGIGAGIAGATVAVIGLWVSRSGPSEAGDGAHVSLRDHSPASVELWGYQMARYTRDGSELLLDGHELVGTRAVSLPGREEDLYELETQLERLRDLVANWSGLLRPENPRTVAVDDHPDVTLFDVEAEAVEVLNRIHELLDRTDGHVVGFVVPDEVAECALDGAPLRGTPASVNDADGYAEGSDRTDDVGGAIRAVAAFSELASRATDGLASTAVLRTRTLTDHVPHFHSRLSGVGDLASFNSYCADCNQNWIQNVQTGTPDDPTDYEPPPKPDRSTRLRYDVSRDRWVCSSCHRDDVTPLAFHRALDDLLLPTHEFLLEENRTERIGVYNTGIRDKVDYRNRWESENESALTRNRAERQEIEQRLRALGTRVAEAQASLGAYAAVVAEVEVLRRSRLGSIQSDYNDRTAAIQASNDEFLQRQTEFVSKLRADLAAELENLARLEAVERKKEQEILGAIAQNTSSIAASSAQTAQNTSSIAASSEQMAADTRTVAAVKKAEAHQKGLDRGQGVFGIPKNISLAVEGATAKVLGKSEIKEADKRHVT